MIGFVSGYATGVGPSARFFQKKSKELDACIKESKDHLEKFRADVYPGTGERSF